MSEISDMQDMQINKVDKPVENQSDAQSESVPLTKAKKPRSQKQIEAFERTQLKR